MTVIGNKSLKELVGVVVGSKNDKTCAVKVEDIKMHPIFKKRFKTYKKYYAHDVDNLAKEGTRVVIRQCRPMSKTKRWKYIETL